MIKPQQFIGLLGRNGIGKSTLLKTIAGLHKPLAGEITIEGDYKVKYLHPSISKRICFLSAQRVNPPFLTVYEWLSIARSPFLNKVGKVQEEDKILIQKALKRMNLDQFEQRIVSSLSDGEYQRSLIAQALVRETPIILLDEPTAFLDYPTKQKILILLKQLAQEERKIIIMSTHDVELAFKYCDQCMLVNHQTLHSLPKGSTINQIQQLFNDV